MWFSLRTDVCKAKLLLEKNMAKFNALLNLRLKQKDAQKPKMSALAERSTSGNLSSFSGVFRVTALDEKEKNEIEGILKNFRESENYDVQKDLEELMTITSEVRAITNQAVILHGERIKKAQNVLKTYKDGAFTAWLITTYGNRQTPYNFLQYYEFYTTMPSSLHEKIDSMPRQAIYTLASRSGTDEKKQSIIQNYTGQPKQELLSIIRMEFPLPEGDKRLPNPTNQVIHVLKRAKSLMKKAQFQPTVQQKKQIFDMLRDLHEWLE